ncbi:MAG: thioredoxin [Spirochaetae bacterium HGW-Spirochaetae-1]|jgi:thioredoxin 1|nr:MAG: thioredoxin [Spirochaetae bacterium HGW-Spirochaetae-1]
MRTKEMYTLKIILSLALVTALGCGNDSSTNSTQAAQKKGAAPEITIKNKSEKKISLKVTFVEIGSVNCIPCKMMQPVMKEVESKYGDQVKVVFYDVWTAEGRPYGQQYGIRVIPTQVFLDASGKEYFRHEGFFPFEQLEQVLKKGGVE